MIYIRAHSTPQGDIIAMCDKELLGKKFSQGKLELDLEKYKSFYEGELKSDADAKKEVGQFRLYSANVVGKQSVKIFVELGLASKEDIKEIGGIPTLHVYKMDAV